MKRRLYQNLLSWKKRKTRKPLILDGVRQVGKTHLLKEFGKNAFSNSYYINFEKTQKVHSIFEGDFDPLRIKDELEFYFKASINTQNTLLIFDEIQACPRALTSLKYFCEDLPDLAIVAAGSLIGLSLGEASFPVGKVDMLTLYPMSFEEFLEAIEDTSALKALKKLTWKTPPSQLVHEHLWSRLKEYLVVGGMPEVVKTFRDHLIEGSFSAMDRVREKQQDLNIGYLADMAKHAGKQNALHLERVWEGVISQLGQARQDSISKFRFRGVVPGISHASRLMNAIDWLVKTGLVIRVPIVSAGKIPLISGKQGNVFKLCLFDVGILGALTDLSPKAILDYDYGHHKGFFIENFVAQALSCSKKQLYSWQEGRAEVDFLWESEGNVLPIEVKAGKALRAKSLGKFWEKFSPPCKIISSPCVMESHGQTYYLPLYLAHFIEKFARLALK